MKKAYGYFSLVNVIVGLIVFGIVNLIPLIPPGAIVVIAVVSCLIGNIFGVLLVHQSFLTEIKAEAIGLRKDYLAELEKFFWSNNAECLFGTKKHIARNTL